MKCRKERNRPRLLLCERLFVRVGVSVELYCSSPSTFCSRVSFWQGVRRARVSLRFIAELFGADDLLPAA